MRTHKVILNEHAQLDILLRDLRTVTHWNPELLAGKEVRSRLATDLESLKAQLLRHFETEESGAYMEEISSRMPSAKQVLESLQAQHPVFIQQITSLVQLCGKAESNREICTNLQNKLSWVLDLLKHHEIKENDLIKTVFQS